MRTTPLVADNFPFAVTYAVLKSNARKPLAAAASSEDRAESALPELQLLVGDPDETFALASVTKPIAAYAVLTGIENGDFQLDEAAGPEKSTLLHLLAHASGLPSTPGAAIAQPGKRRIYSNYGFDVLAQWVEERTGETAAHYIKRRVLQPLGMDTTEISGSIADSGRSTLDSLLRFAGELLAPTLISRELMSTATIPAFDGIPGILPGYGRQKNNTWGLGFEIRSKKTPHWLAPEFSPDTFGHFGQSGSFLWVDPQIGKAGVFLGAQRFGQTHLALWPELTAQMRAL
ncbi:serine hydrolase domain-containing protein [Arcanobacterium hippocoleae]|uniref:CubicO group peptidase (Beta-lactamase class C family) n=1 Tax=Arcanobacterium hippocoleae TaxID=149017 RepID=A0ABU1T393_9ACTO|nr:serine hydrolase domain-containing protein [Arcanobacterium hippocoleae]MDR6939710.1 CubicO group peptidase (beta-lactamase class C family) [Arcanobacterium hippocoleae]